MDLIRALDILSAQVDTGDDHNLRKEKIEACRTISEQICAPSLRNTADFPRFLSIAISLLLRAHGDKDLNVYSVAEESLNRTIKILIYSYHERILFELFKVLKGKPQQQQDGKRLSTSYNGSEISNSLATQGGSIPSTPVMNMGSNLSSTNTTPSFSSPLSSNNLTNIINNLGGSTQTPTPSSSSNANSLFNTASQILSKPFPIKSQRIALVKFGEVCSFIRPSKCRKYILSLVPPINILLQIHDDESLQESIATSMENISKILIPYLKENEVHQLIDLFAKNLSQTSAAVRRAASLSITSICRHYPKPLFEYTIESLFSYTFPNSPPIASITSSQCIPNSTSTNTQSNSKILGVLFSYLQLIKLSEELSLSDIKILDSFSLKIQFFVHFILKYIQLPDNDNEQYDHNVVGLSLELLQQLLVTFGPYEHSWPKPLVQQVISQLRSLCFQQHASIRVSLKAVVLNCLAQSVKYFPKLFNQEFFSNQYQQQNAYISSISPSDLNFKLFTPITQQEQQQQKSQGAPPLSASTASTNQSFLFNLEPKEEFLNYLTDSDPLLRGGTALMIGCLIRGFLETDHITSNQIYPTDVPLLQDNISIPTLLIFLLRALMDSSSVTAKLACTGIGECLPTLCQSKYSDWALVTLRHLLCVSSSTYWLVKLEILETLSKIDYIVIEYLEQNVQHRSNVMNVSINNSTDGGLNNSTGINNSSSSSGEKETGGAVAIPIQSKVLDFLIEQLSDNDFRVRNSAGQALVSIIPRLVFTAPLERHSMKGISSNVRESFDVPDYENTVLKKRKIFANLSHVIGFLVNQLSNPHPDDKIRGCYHALNLICQTYSFPPDTPQECRSLSSILPNPMLSFVGDILPLALDRVGLTWVATDFDVHIDIIEVLGYLSRGAENVLGSYCYNVLRHIVRIINIATNIIQFRPTPPLKEVKSNPSGIVNSPLLKAPTHLGAFTHSIHYIKLYSKLLAARVNSITIFGSDRFSQLRQSCFETLAVILKCAGKTILPYTEEIIGYLTTHFEQEPVSVIKCINELFLVTMKPTPLVSISSLSQKSKDLNNIGGSSSSSSSSSLKQYEPRSIESHSSSSNPHDEMFLNSKSVFSSLLTFGTPNLKQHYEYAHEVPSSHNINYSYSNQEINRIISGEDRKVYFKLFEPLIVGSMVEYQTTHNHHLKIAILLMFSKFSKFGLDLSLFDKEQHFPTYFINELKETNCLLSKPYKVLSYSYDLLGSIFIHRKLYPDLNIGLDDLKKLFYQQAPVSNPSASASKASQSLDSTPMLASNNNINQASQSLNNSSLLNQSSHPYSYTIPTIIENCHSFVRYLYDPLDKYPDTEFRDGFLNFLLSNLQYSQTIDLLILIVTLIKSNNPLYSKYSQQISHQLFTSLSLGDSPFFIINSIEEVEKLYVLIDKLHNSSLSASRWADALLSVSPQFVNNTNKPNTNTPTPSQATTTTTSDPLQRKRILLLRESILEAYELRWLPPLLVILRTGCKLPEESRISAARQSRYLSNHDNKQQSSPSANIISHVILKLIRNAVQVFSLYKPKNILFTQLINHLLYYSSIFFNKNLVPHITPSTTNVTSPHSTSPNIVSSTSPLSMSSHLMKQPSATSLLGIASNNLFTDSLKIIIATNEGSPIIHDIVNSLLSYGGTSTSIHVVKFLLLLGRDDQVWKSYAMSSYWQTCGCEHFLTHHIIFLLYCQAIIILKLPIDLTETFLDKMVLLINEFTIKKLIESIKGEYTETLTNHLKKILSRASNSLDLRKKQKLLRLLSYLPANRETIELLIVNFIQTDDISLQVSGERILNLKINTLIEEYGTTKSLDIIQELYQIFMSNFVKSTTNLSVQSLFLKLIKNLSPNSNITITPTIQVIKQDYNSNDENHEEKEEHNENKDNEELINNNISIEKLTELQIETLKSGYLNDYHQLSTIPWKYFIELIKSRYFIHMNQHSFNHISILSQIDKEATVQLLESNRLDSTLLPEFISSNYSLDYQDEIQNYLLKKMDKLLAKAGEIGSDPLKGGPPFLSDPVWDELRETTRCLSNFINKFGINDLCESNLLQVSTWAFIESFRRWRAEIINPYDFKLVLELSRSIILKSTASILTITDDSSWCSLLLCLYKLYCLVIRPHFGYISGQRELEENFSQDPTQISLTQSNEMVKFLVSLLTNSKSYSPMPGSHIGQLIFDSFIRAIIPLATKAFDFIYPTLTASDENEFGGGIIPNCPIFSSIVSPEQNIRALVRFIHFVEIDNEEKFGQVWRILEPIFVAQLGDAEIGTDEITEESKCVALSGMTSMIIKVCFEISGVNSQVNLLETSTIPKPIYNHIPREKDLIFLNTPIGKKLNNLLSIIYGGMPQSELPLGGGVGTIGTSSTLSAYHFNIERSFSSNSFGSDQISLQDLRLFKVPSFIGINFTPLIKKLLESFEGFLLNQMCPPMLKKEILRSVVTLSDLFNRDQVCWMFRTFQAIITTDEIDDFFLKQHLILGICKSIAILQHPPNIADINAHAVGIFEMLKAALEHPNISLQVSALDGILYLLEGKVNKYIQGPLLQYLFRWIPTRLSSSHSPPVSLTLRVLATMFLMIEQYSREAEETLFTKRAVTTCIQLGQQSSTPAPIVYGVFRGLDRLLGSFSLSHSQRESISQFSLKSLPSENPIRSLLALGLMVTCIYTGDETGITSPSKSSVSSIGSSGINSLTAFEGLSFNPSSDSPLNFSGTSSSNGSISSIINNHNINNNDSDDNSDPERNKFSRVNNMEKVKMLFDKIRLVSHFSYEAYVLSQVIPTVIIDLFPSVDQLLSFILGEFLKQSKSNPKLMCQIISKVFDYLLENDKDKTNQHLINYWIIICLQNFFQIQNPNHCLWALTYLFLTSSPLKSFKLLESEFASKIQTNEKLFLIIAAEFYFNKDLTKENKQLFKDSFSKLKSEPYISLMKVIKNQ
ncbi:hypothetical protein DICPUDRAFT_95859 [Dictyostelium purpureum]|uniref:Uncharacterized protein n=1 Tax=Dictyostelium purpureum TaxID=5786 RepID=F1A1P7_DICPU|nr:uncharacterized protein DICPUDRAFT_95859 [Dictyostelium purpureum]EGC29883.1 hypothetical protein DICPUDRAFT_95859 [Dictyostelium purpureum]|eukprot:XP_003293590.1 hypothetical protein DICPUDRAFT_95859 [Dictyostelium purpureum]